MRLTLLGCDRKTIAETIGTSIDSVDTIRRIIVRLMDAPNFATAVEVFRIMEDDV
jgi:DNA-binding CsgD family transcriptional regulator